MPTSAHRVAITKPVRPKEKMFPITVGIGRPTVLCTEFETFGAVEDACPYESFDRFFKIEIWFLVMVPWDDEGIVPYDVVG